MIMSASLVVASFSTVAAALDPLGAIVDTSPCPIPSTQYRSDTVVVPITNASSITSRLKYPTAQHVTLEVQNDLTDVQWFLNSSYSNTTIVSKCGVGYSLTAAIGNIPIIVNVASDIFIYALRVNVNYDWTVAYYDAGYISPSCSDPNINKIVAWTGTTAYVATTPLCPAIMAFGVNRIQIAGNAIYGKTVLSNCTDTLFENNYVTTHGLAEGIHVANVGNSDTLTTASLIIRNNLINDTYTGVMLGAMGTGAAVGVQIVNNNFTNFMWTSVQFGRGLSVAESISNYMAYNYVYRSTDYPIMSGSSSIYMDTHWFGINNTVYHNYIYQRFDSGCIDMDFVTSGTNFTRNICDGGMMNLKTSIGRNNIISDFLVIGTTFTYQSDCQNATVNNCNGGHLGAVLWNPTLFSGWEWMAAAPWASTFCTDKYINGIRCNVNDTMDILYGNCSGLPVLNDYRFVTVNATNVMNMKLPLNGTGQGLVCGTNIPNIDLLNTFNQTIYTSTNVTRGSDGLVLVVSDSMVAREYPNLTVFDVSLVGVKASNQSNYVGLSWSNVTVSTTKTLSTSLTSFTSSTLSTNTTLFATTTSSTTTFRSTTTTATSTNITNSSTSTSSSTTTSFTSSSSPSSSTSTTSSTTPISSTLTTSSSSFSSTIRSSTNSTYTSTTLLSSSLVTITSTIISTTRSTSTVISSSTPTIIPSSITNTPTSRPPTTTSGSPSTPSTSNPMADPTLGLLLQSNGSSDTNMNSTDTASSNDTDTARTLPSTHTNASGLSSGAIGGIVAAVSLVTVVAIGGGVWKLHQRGVFSKFKSNN